MNFILVVGPKPKKTLQEAFKGAIEEDLAISFSAGTGVDATLEGQKNQGPSGKGSSMGRATCTPRQSEHLNEQLRPAHRRCRYVRNELTGIPRHLKKKV
jgi:hypothetical protein